MTKKTSQSNTTLAFKGLPPFPLPKGRGQATKTTFFIRKHLIFSTIVKFIFKIYRLLFLNVNAVTE